MPVTLYTQEEVEIYTRALARAYDVIRDRNSTDDELSGALKRIEKVLGWRGPPPMRARPPSDEEALDAMIKSHVNGE